LTVLSGVRILSMIGAYAFDLAHVAFDPALRRIEGCGFPSCLMSKRGKNEWHRAVHKYSRNVHWTERS